MIMQDPQTSLNPVYTVGDQVSEPIRLHLKERGERVMAMVLDALRAVRIPQPAEQRGDWSWIQATSTAKGSWATIPVDKADARARLAATPLVLREGWLRFLPDDIDE